jgi:hypothetical protein
VFGIRHGHVGELFSFLFHQGVEPIRQKRHDYAGAYGNDEQCDHEAIHTVAAARLTRDNG